MYQEIGILNYSSGKELWPNFLWGQEMANRRSNKVIQNSPGLLLGCLAAQDRRSDYVIQNSPVGPLNNPIVTQ